jgi:hypothetical protein
MLFRRTIDRWHPADAKGNPRPFPNAATFLGIALGLIVLWLLAGGLPKIMGWPEPPAKIEAGASR